MFTSEVPRPQLPSTDRMEPAGSLSAEARGSLPSYDLVLVERFKQGDEGAFAEIAVRYRRKLYLKAFDYLRDEEDAEEVAQDALLRAHRALAHFRGESSLYTWLHRIVSNLARNRYWHSKRRGAGRTLSLEDQLTEGPGEKLAAMLPDGGRTASQEIAVKEFERLIECCMDKIEPSYREILTLANIDSLPYEDISVRLKIAKGTVKSRLARARGKLASALRQECPDFGDSAPPSSWFEPSAQGLSTARTRLPPPVGAMGKTK